MIDFVQMDATNNYGTIAIVGLGFGFALGFLGSMYSSQIANFLQKKAPWAVTIYRKLFSTRRKPPNETKKTTR